MQSLTGRREAAIDLLVVGAAIIAAWLLCRGWLYPALGFPGNTPILLRPLGGLLVAWWLLRNRGSDWQALGLRRPASWLRVAMGAIGLYLALMAMSRWLVPPLADWLQVEAKPSFIGYVRGDLPAALLWISIGWGVGGFCEEALFRGFLLNRVADALGGGRWALAIGVLAQAALFGMLHLYSGAFACVHAAMFALVMGAFYLLSGRNLWPLIVVHGIWDSIAIWSVYSG